MKCRERGEEDSSLPSPPGISFVCLRWLSMAGRVWQSAEVSAEVSNDLTDLAVTSEWRVDCAGNSHSNASSVEFYDVASGQWGSLPSLQAARHSHVMMVQGGRLTVLGGQHGRDVLGDMETFDGKRWDTDTLEADVLLLFLHRWVRSKRGLSSARRGFSVVKVPAERFRKMSIKSRKVWRLY